MTKEIIFSFSYPYRDDFNIYGYRFGKGEKACCVIGAIRGNEIQQLYVCSRVVRALTELEKQGKIYAGKEIFVIPSLNPHSMNIGKRFWTEDNRDINRCFPGNLFGDTTHRIAATILKKVSAYQYGVQFTSFYIPGDFIPHVRMMETGKESASLAGLFGLPYIHLREPSGFDLTTLNYNWQMNGTSAFSVYTNETENIDENSAQLAVTAVLRFMMRMGIIKYQCHSGYIATTVRDDMLIPVKTKESGFYRRLRQPGDEVSQGEILAEILHPYENNVIDEIVSPACGTVFFAHKSPLVMENTVVYNIIKRLHS